MSDGLPSQIRTALTAIGLPPPSTQWLLSLLASRNPPPPLQSLIATAKARLLASDLTTPQLLEPSTPAFPVGMSGAAEAKEVRLPTDVVVQVLDVENLSRSRWEQVEELEAIERGEQTRGREVVRLPPPGEEDEEGGPPPEERGPAAVGSGRGGGGAGKSATHKVVLQDCKGQKVFGLELRRINRFGVGTLNIGEKLLVRAGAVVARGLILLEPANCVVLGGKVEAWHKAWVDGRLARLRQEVAARP